MVRIHTLLVLVASNICCFFTISWRFEERVAEERLA